MEMREEKEKGKGKRRRKEERDIEKQRTREREKNNRQENSYEIISLKSPEMGMNILYISFLRFFLR